MKFIELLKKTMENKLHSCKISRKYRGNFEIISDKLEDKTKAIFDKCSKSGRKTTLKSFQKNSGKITERILKDEKISDSIIREITQI